MGTSPRACWSHIDGTQWAPRSVHTGVRSLGMGDHAMLDFAGRFVSIHQDAEYDGPIEVIPTVHDTIEMDHEALEAITTRYAGRYIRWDDLAPGRPEARGAITSGRARPLPPP